MAKIKYTLVCQKYGAIQQLHFVSVQIIMIKMGMPSFSGGQILLRLYLHQVFNNRQ